MIFVVFSLWGWYGQQTKYGLFVYVRKKEKTDRFPGATSKSEKSITRKDYVKHYDMQSNSVIHIKSDNGSQIWSPDDELVFTQATLKKEIRGELIIEK